MSIRVGKGGSSIEMSSGLEDMVRRVLNESAPKVIETLERETAELRASAEASWPVGPDRGRRAHSRDLFDHGIRLPDGTTIEGFVSNSADYAWYIRTSRNGVNGNAFQKLVRRPARKMGKRIAEDLADELAALAGGV